MTKTKQRLKAALRAAFPAGWRSVAAGLTGLITTLTATIAICLIVSLHHRGNESESGLGTSLLLKGDCDLTSRYNTWLHLAINIISSGVLASSNFFMQIMVAPTREDVDKAHARSQFLEVGVQSWRNLRHVPWRNVICWALLAITSIPLHLIFNSAVLESRASTDFLMAVTSESFLHGAPWALPGVAEAPHTADSDRERVVTDMQNSILSSHECDLVRWERISIKDCVDRYNNTRAPLTSHRHVVLVISDLVNSTADGWAPSDILIDPSRDSEGPMNKSNALWSAMHFSRNDKWLSDQAERRGKSNYYGKSDFEVYLAMASLSYWINLNVSTGIISANASVFREGFSSMRAEYCLSEAFKVDCRLEVGNTMLLIVCVACLVKCTLCVVILATSRSRVPLITPGDAVESFIMKPDSTTAGMCTFARDDFVNRDYHQCFRWLPSPRAWVSRNRRVGCAVPTRIWIWSYVLIGTSLVVASGLSGSSLQEQPIADSSFWHGSTNKAVEIDSMELNNIMLITVMANTPQLMLSVCYLAYNGLFTRMLCEREWASFGVRYASLRVTHRKGKQRSTYRLQLPYRWSIPLLGISTLLHWLYSNCIYVGIYESFVWYQPLEPEYTTTTLQYSTVAIVISLCISIAVASAPIALALSKLPGDMVLAKNSSAVISAACHCVPTTTSSSGGVCQDDVPLLPIKDSMFPVESREGNALQEMAIGLLKWGAVAQDATERSEYYDVGNPGHLAFGTMEQHVTSPVIGCFYVGRRDDL